MRKYVSLVLMILLSFGLFAQNSDDWLWGEDEEDVQQPEQAPEQDFIRVNYDKKDARRAMIYSMLLPGAGQYYADKSSFTTYLFPALEIGMIAGIMVFNARGDSKTDDFEHYATEEDVAYELGDGTVVITKRYSRERQHRIEDIIMGLNTQDIYESSYFRLDDSNTQHFYEDIGKYPHYVFGWADWYYHFATDQAGIDQDPIWYPGGYEDNPGWVWSGNYPLYDDEQYGYSVEIPVENNTHASSRMRKKYVDMRNEAKSEYSIGRMFTFGLAANHLVAGLDAIRLARKANKGVLSAGGLRLDYYTSLRENNFTPNIGLKWNF